MTVTEKVVGFITDIALDREIEFVNISPEVMGGALKAAGFPEWQAEGLVEDYAHYGRGEAAEVTTGVLDATGKSLGTFDAFAGDYAPAFAT